MAVENGAGTPATDIPGTDNGVGITGMRERAAAIDGSLRAAPLTSGFRVDARLPYALSGA